jgi:predicted pyridoxine 5'-phosphate oxidase superfamily flavin-nucleotide-binding protein
VALLFLIPGVTETMRVNGRAKVTNDPMLLKHFEVNEKLPVVVIEVSVESVYFQCSKAIYRAELWETELADRKSLPSSGEIFKTIEETSFDHETYDKESETRLRKSLY